MPFIKYLENVNNASKDSQNRPLRREKFRQLNLKVRDLFVQPDRSRNFTTCGSYAVNGISCWAEQALTCRKILFSFGYIVISVPCQIAKKYSMVPDYVHVP